MTRPDAIYRIALESELRSELEPAAYRPADLGTGGFVHCSQEASVIPVANDYYANATGRLLLLAIDPAALGAEVRYEAAAPDPGRGSSHVSSAIAFPHVYGPIDRRAITGVGVLQRTGGGYAWPRAFVPLDSFLLAGSWLWLFPAAYLVHLAEEFWAPPTFYGWASRLAGIDFTARLFLLANAVFFTLLVFALTRVRRGAWPAWVVIALGTVIGINALLHLAGTLLTRSYSPGLCSGLLVYLPLAAASFARGVRGLERSALWRGVLAGILIHALVPIVGVLLSVLS